MSQERLRNRQYICTVCFLTAMIMWLPLSTDGYSSRGLAASPQANAPANLLGSFGKRPLSFEPNAGQTDPSIRFLARAKGAVFYFGPSDLMLTLLEESKAPSPKSRVQGMLSSDVKGHGSEAQSMQSEAVVHMHFLGANSSVQIEGDDELPGRVNYLLGTNPSRWHTNLLTYSGITYRELYPGVNLNYSGGSSMLKGTYTVAPGGDPSRIRWEYEGMRVSVDIEGRLQGRTAGYPLSRVDGVQNDSGEPSTLRITEEVPIAWQEKEGRRVPVAVRYIVAPDGSIGFEVGAFDHALPLAIDPTLGYSTYLGGTGHDLGTGIAVVGGNAYVSGLTSSVDFPLANPRQPGYGGGSTDVFVTAFNTAGNGLIYSTYLGGSGSEDSWALAVDADGSAYVAGFTDSTDFPLANPIQSNNRGYRDAFIGKLSPDGSALVYSTYLGGTGWDEAWAVDVDRDGFAHIAGTTSSADFPTRNPIQGTNRGGNDVFLTKLTREGTALVYSTYLGGGGSDGALGVRTDRNRNAFLTGGTESNNFPTRNPFQGSSSGGQEVFLTKVDRDGTQWVYSTYLGGSGDDLSWALAVSEQGNAYLTGYTASNNFPTRNPVQPANGGGRDGFVTAFNSTGSALIYSTYLGGNGIYDAGYGIAVDVTGSAYAGGLTSSSNFPVVDPIQPNKNGGEDDGFVSKLSPGGAPLIYSTYLGGSSGDFVYGTAVDALGNAYVAGQTDSLDFPIANPFQANRAGGHDGFVAKIVGPPIPTATPTPTHCPFNFSDVQVGDYFYEAVRSLYCAGVISGYDDQTFRPFNNTTRGQLSKIIVLAEGWPLYMPPRPTFTDVPPTNPFYAYIETAHSRGAIAGYADGTFRPGNDVTRGQLCKIVCLAAGWPLISPPTPSFRDVSTGDAFYTYIETAYRWEIISGYGDGTFRPGNAAVRGQICKIVYNASLVDWK